METGIVDGFAGHVANKVDTVPDGNESLGEQVESALVMLRLVRSHANHHLQLGEDFIHPGLMVTNNGVAGFRPPEDVQHELPVHLHRRQLRGGPQHRI